MENTTTKSNLTLNNRNELNLTGIKKVKSTEPTLIIANIDNGNIIINGNNLSVQQLDVKEGILSVTGVVNSIKYSANVSKSFSLKNMFK
jgi:sporulation protein YabP